MKNRTTASVEDIRSAFTKAGIRIDGTWLDIGRGAERAKNKVEDVGDEVDDLPRRTTTTIETRVEDRPLERLVTTIRSLTTGEHAVRIGAQVYGGIGGRQHGGHVEAGRAYLVGEVRPELFVPDSPGRIEPRPSVVRAADAGLRGDTTVNLQVHGLPMRASTPAEVVAQLRRGARMGYLEPRRRAAWSPSGG
jgi:hypothetical protein